MKTLFIPVMSKKTEVSNLDEISSQLPKSIAIAYSVQFKDLAINIRDNLKESHKITGFAQVLGCSSLKLPKTTQALLLIGQGRFHALGIASSTNSKLPIYIYESGKLAKVSESDISALEKKQKAAYLKYLHADNVGIIITTKPGQSRLNKAIEFKKKLKANDKIKKSYLFMANNINTSEFENFPGIESWVNTACPRMDMNNSDIINISHLE